MANKNPLKTIREADKSFEAVADLGSDVVKTIGNDLVKEGGKDFMRQLLGLEEYATKTVQALQGELEEGQEISFAKKQAEKKSEKRASIEPASNYHRDIIHAETMHVQLENRELREKLESIQVELKKITQTSKELEVTFKAVSKETLTRTVKPGKYHVNFFEWMLLTLQNARVRIESSASWISAISSKKSKKDFWSLAKSHGTSYSLSSERAVAQQVG